MPFPRERERAWWLLLVGLVGCVAAGLWAVAPVLGWPIPVRVALTALAAVVGLVVPELRARRAADQRQERLVARVEVRGRKAWLPRVRDVSDAELRVHASRLEVPYIARDKQADVDSALLARQPLLIVGHSMAGKTRLAASRIRALLPDATLLAPLPGAALRELVDNRLHLADTVVWLDDLERFLTGESRLDPGLLGTLSAAGAVVVATIRRNALEVYRPSNRARPPQWETISRFKRVDLARMLSAEESRAVDAYVADSAVRAKIHRYGLAEYLGAGPDAVDRFDGGETECPVGAALVRAAIDWRRAGLARLVRRRDLQAALRIYLTDRSDVSVDEASVTDGLQWAMEKVNETVSLLMPNYRAGGANVDAKPHDGEPLFEVFDYLVDVLEERKTSEDRLQRDKALIPIDMYRLVIETASRDELADVKLATRAQSRFVNRTEELAQLSSWLASPLSGPSPPLGFLYGPAGIGKTAILRRLQELADPGTHELIAGDPAQLLLNVPPFDVVLSARHLTASQLIALMFKAAGRQQPWFDGPDSMIPRRLVSGDHSIDQPMIIAIDGLDEAINPDRTIDMLLELCRDDYEVPLRILVTTRHRPPEIPGIVKVFEVSMGSRESLVELARSRIVAAEEPPSAELADQTAQVIADFAGGFFLASSMLSQMVASGSLPQDPDMLVQKLEDLTQNLEGGSYDLAPIRVPLERWLASLGKRRPDALVLLTALARGPAQGMTAEEWLAAASRLGNRPYSRADVDWLSESGVIGRPRKDGTYQLHDLVRAFVLDHGT